MTRYATIMSLQTQGLARYVKDHQSPGRNSSCRAVYTNYVLWFVRMLNSKSTDRLSRAAGERMALTMRKHLVRSFNTREKVKKEQA